jgi:hypothetical protein
MMPRRALPALLLLATLALTGCVAIKSESATTRLPGVVTLNLSICASHREAGSSCIPNPVPAGLTANTIEADNGSDAPTTTGQPQPAQLLVGFRVPDGTVAPEEFRSPDGEVFDKSPTYTAALTADRTAPAGFHWEGYLSSTVNLDAGTQLTSFSAEFGLPPGPGGAPFAGPFRWRAIAGIRLVNRNAGDPVSCGQGSDCYDSPPPGDLFTQLVRTVSDFRVLPGTGATAAPGDAATVSFPLRYSDAAGFGAQTLSLSAASGLPGTPRPAVPATLSIAPGATPSVAATVTVPAGTAPGTYPVTLTAAEGAPAVTRSNTATITVVDRTAPAIRIGSPSDGETLTEGQQIAADYSCADEANGSGLASCTGTVPNGAAIDTATPGPKTFTVTATDRAGNAATLTRTYTVQAPPPPVVRPQVTFALSFLDDAGRRSTRFKVLAAKGVPKRATVRVTCKGHGCPRRSFTKRHASGSVSLKPYVRTPLRTGIVLTVSVTKPGAVGMVKTLTIRPRAPRLTTACLPPGAKKPTRCA